MHKLSALFIAAPLVILQAEIHFSTIQGINYYIFSFCFVHPICFVLMLITAFSIQSVAFASIISNSITGLKNFNVYGHGNYPSKKNKYLRHKDQDNSRGSRAEMLK